MENSDCDFVETTERGNYCCLKRCACTVEKCEVLKYGLGKECKWKTGEEVFLWWMEDENIPGQMSIEDFL